MSWKLVKIIREARHAGLLNDLTFIEFSVLMLMADTARETTSRVQISMSELEMLTGMSRRNVSRIVSGLLSKQCIRRDQYGTPGRASRYVLLMVDQERLDYVTSLSREHETAASREHETNRAQHETNPAQHETNPTGPRDTSVSDPDTDGYYPDGNNPEWYARAHKHDARHASEDDPQPTATTVITDPSPVVSNHEIANTEPGLDDGCRTDARAGYGEFSTPVDVERERERQLAELDRYMRDHPDNDNDNDDAKTRDVS